MLLLEGAATESPIPHTAPEVAHVYAWTVYDKMWLQTFLLMKEHSYTAHFSTWVNTGRKKVILIQDYSITTSIAHPHPSSFWWSTLHIGWHHQRLHKSCQCFQCYCPPKTTMGSANCLKKMDIYWGLSLVIFVPRLKVLFFTNHYLLVCIFKYRTSTRIFSLKKCFNLVLDI